MIISGAIRAIRHPERYGPRPGRRLSTTGSEDDSDPHNAQFQGRQTRAAGLTRAILDTFPVVKFGRSGNTAVDPQKVLSKEEDQSFMLQTRSSPVLTDKPKEQDIESNIPSPQIPVPSSPTTHDSLDQPHEEQVSSGGEVDEEEEETPSSAEMEQMVCDVNNSVTCPICVCDFDAEDDIRVLPCDARHRFHQECVDPWL